MPLQTFNATRQAAARPSFSMYHHFGTDCRWSVEADA
jgi:hypothetical protein